MKKAIFLDRDGVLVRNIEGQAATKVEDLELVLKSIPILRKLKRKGYKIFIISNQPDIALGKIDEDTKKALVKKFADLLIKNNLKVDGIYYCFHHPKAVVKKYAKNCFCRKPKPGLILKAIRDHQINPSDSFIIGDRATDVKAGSLAKVKSILLDPDNLERDFLLKYNVEPDFTIKKLADIDKVIL